MNITTKIDGLTHRLSGPAFEIITSLIKPEQLLELTKPLITARRQNHEPLKDLFPEVRFVVSLDPMLSRRPGDQINLTVQFAVGVLADATGQIVEANPEKALIARRVSLKILTGNLIGLPTELLPHHPSRRTLQSDALPSFGD